MNIERWLQIHIVALCLLGSLFIALNTGDFAVPLGVLFAGCTAIAFTDMWKWFHLNRLLGNLAAVGAVVFALRNFLISGSEGQLLAIASLLVYLQIVLFYQEKNTRLYWQMILLSLLQVVVGAALNLGLSFGLLLMAYTAVAVSALVLFFIHRETERHVATLQLGKPRRTAKANPWLGRSAVVTVPGDSEEFGRPFLSGQLARQIVAFTLSAMIFAAAFFYSVPRHSQAAWTGTRGFSHVESGFSRDVELQQMGKMLQNNSPVMRVRLFDALGRPLARIDPYFAGEVLTTYHNDKQHASWLSPRRAVSPLDRVGFTVPYAPPSIVVQHVEMEATYHNTLFAIVPAFAVSNTPEDVRMDSDSRLLYRRPESDNFIASSFTFDVGTTAIRAGRQVAIVPNHWLLGTEHGSNGNRREIATCLEFDREQFAGLRQTAEKVVADLPEPDRGPLAVARALEQHFLTPGAYSYSLDLNIARDPDLDPIEDFVMNHRTGHCQYFASALVLMLRSQGIPARMVVGYRGDEYNEIGQFYQVRQRNAHAWVEALLTKDQIPEHETVAGPLTAAGGWLRLDPTPADERAAEQLTSWAGTARDWIDYVNTIWSDYVIGMNQQRQQATLYGNTSASDALAESWMNPERWTGLYTFASWLGIHITPEGEAGFQVVFDWRAGLTAMTLCGLGVVLARLGRKHLGRFDWAALLGRRRIGAVRSRIAFYARLEELLARRGRTRRPAETAHEYVDQAVREVAVTNSDAVRQTVEAFYRVRFGEGELSEAEQEAVQQTLAELERTPVVVDGSRA
jgi:transglutaminase-like putative cysteine protease